jgi:phage-related protein
VKELHQSGDIVLIKTIHKYIEALKRHGKLMNMEFSKGTYEQLETNLFEIKPGRVRILFTYKEGTFYLLHAFYKKSNQTPEQEKSIARTRMRRVFANTGL